ncbi:ERCC4 domain-containing protein [Mycena leptocephala]|nr:ERCC4 domain-containing protein [Mycena leptocephala]
MPRATGPRRNAHFLGLLQGFRDEHEQGSNNYNIYNKAFYGLKNHEKELATPRELIEVKGIGPKIVDKLEKLYAADGRGNSQPVAAAAAPKKPRGRPLKRSATDLDSMDPPPASKRRTVSAAVLPTQVPATQVPPPTLERPAMTPGPFQFWYINERNERVLDCINAKTSWCEDGSQLLRMKIGYPVTQANHPLAAQLFGRERRGDNVEAEMREDTAELFPQCTALAVVQEAAPPPPKASTLSALLAEEKLAQKRSQNTIDPSRQLPGYLRKETNAVASGSRDKTTNAVASGSRDKTNVVASGSRNISDMRLAAASRSYSGLSQVSRASSPPASQLTASPSTSLSSSPPVRPPPQIRRAATATAAASSSVSGLHRTASAPMPLHTRPRLSHAVPALPPVEHPSIYTPLTTFPEFTPRVFKAGMYTIHLLLDHREKKNKNDREKKDNRQAMADTQPCSCNSCKDLQKNGVSVNHHRALELGDVAWIARSADGEECVLDVVLERKRLDDLVGSIKDGRFHEQKFRLHQSGISTVFYLVEEYDSRRQRDEYGVQISTALSSTQVVDGFLVKQTKNFEDTMAYLTGLTEELGRAHANKDLFVIPKHMIRRHSYLDLKKYLHTKFPSKCFVTSFDDFQTLNSKSAYTTVRDTWARMLLCVKGMSAEKVGAVVEQWDTPRALWEAFREAQIAEQDALAWEAAEAEAAAPKGKGKGKKKSTVREARLMLQGVGGAEGGVRAIGQALSTKLYDLFMSEDYEEGD